ncbi:hypothetical protein GZ77_01800 [Endozoicomonas montiporae]|uniref:Uncharacterized protein n=2 Tax=Endozoicomonas montiporae TaxID=1027273 RepID=A0A081NAD4_9GAMM|nr:hypothetical protein [Endozoicomonas montiporae]AMO56914.1 hypothetical protein EZMO1_2869 [Endozoicomonas montiporae CL-33]KEQ15407.1 hypothetical protein GZ77_01800 [Endozoicomonas montiporae]
MALCSFPKTLWIFLVSLLLAACGQPPQQPKTIVSEGTGGTAFIGVAARANPVETLVSQHPFMAGHGASTIHGDGFNSDVHMAAGPLGINPQMQTRRGSRLGAGMCATITFNQQGQLLALCASLAGFRIELLAPRTLESLAVFKLPGRPSTFQALVNMDKSIVMTDSSGGAYYYLDDQDRVVLADSQQRIVRLSHYQQPDGQWQFSLDGSWDLSKQVPNDCQDWGNWFPSGECDPITAVMPDKQGLIWWVTRKGRIGTLNSNTGRVKNIHLEGEEIQNGFSVAPEAVYIVSDHAMYALTTDLYGKPEIMWREAYDRGSERKVGSINQGSGTTPTLLGEEYVTITDNADGQINLLVYRRQPTFNGERLICSVPLFEQGFSATDNSMIGFNRSIIIENNAGYSNAYQQKDWSAIRGGVSRIDVREDESGCDLVWHSKEKVPSVVPKLSAGNGLVYVYTFEQQPDSGEVVWYVTAISLETGETRFKVRTGSGKAFDNNWAPITIGPDGTLYVGTLMGLVAVWDEPEPESIVTGSL